MTRPTLRAVLLGLVGLPIAVLPALVDARLWPAWIVFVAGYAALVAYDALFLPSPRACGADIRVPGALYVGATGDEAEVELRRRGRGPRARIEVLTELDPKLAAQPSEHVVLSSDGPTRVRVPLVPERRGEATIGPLWLRASGPLGLAQRSWRIAGEVVVPVLPDVRAVRAAAVRFFGERTAVSGLKTERYIGDGSEFDSLRGFTRGFDSNAIDWKASAKHRELLVKTYRAERNHQVIIAFDTGRLMGEPLDGLPRVDRAANAGLLLAYACLKTGDRVGVFSFDSRPGAYLQPRGGVHAFPTLQQRIAALEYTDEETNYTLGFTDLLERLERRSLVVVFTEFVDSVAAELMVSNLQYLSRRHVVLFVALRDPLLRDLVEREPASVEDVNRAAIAVDLVQDRKLVLKRLRQARVHCLDVHASEVSTELLSQYLEIRRRELV